MPLRRRREALRCIPYEPRAASRAEWRRAEEQGEMPASSRESKVVRNTHDQLFQALLIASEPASTSASSC